MIDNVNHPKHCVDASVRVEPIDLLRYAPFDLGCAMKYLIRFDKKGKPVEDLQKAIWYLKCVEESCEFNYELYNTFIKNHAQLIYKFFPYAKGNNHPCYAELIRALRRYAEQALFFRTGEIKCGNQACAWEDSNE